MPRPSDKINRVASVTRVSTALFTCSGDVARGGESAGWIFCRSKTAEGTCTRRTSS